MLVSILNQLQTTTGIKIRTGPIWMIPSKSTAKLISPAPGTPARINPRPASNAWTTAIPITPREILRSVAQTDAEPCYRAEHDNEAAQGYCRCRQRTMPEKFCREPLEDRV